MTPFYLHHLLSLLTQTSKTKKAMFSGFYFVHQQYSTVWGGVLFTATSSILMFYQHSRYGSTIVSTLVYGCEETTCYFCFADRYREGETAGHFLLDSYYQEAFCSNIKKIYIYNTLHHLWVVQFYSNSSCFSYKDDTAMKVAGLKNTRL